MSHSSRCRPASSSALALLILALAPAIAAAQLVTLVGTSVGVDAAAVNPSAGQPGVSRNTSGTGPIADTAAELVGFNSATASAAVDAFGLHASSVVHGDSTNAFATASARGIASLVNPFIVVPHAGFTGSQALLRIPYSFGGTINLLPSLAACETCFGAVQASVGVDGMSDQFFFLGVASQGTMHNADFSLGGAARAGVLEGLVPVNTELYLRAGLMTQVHCQSDTVLSCGSEALFGGTLSYTGFSPDAVDLVWGLTPLAVAAVPEPQTWLLLVAGLGFVGRRLQRQAR